ncbi:probable LRR receptor-like serine/threonine-protein kinase At3g47570 [Quercus lobata]|uniref:probable LRR receptor-like serine/threonine-protein kinase At3g47570 n=1 Tax=Quercus lobata TaxID=97700 RepID=UPI0012461E20|nr:probable LRR receptor-like serine/threonine-protein kinase At3g47570 [Quercus lobata]
MVIDNLFSGEIPDIFSNLMWLHELDMANNRLSGRIPMSKATCQQLEMLVLARTALNGSIPKQIFELPQLKFLLLANNSLSGFLPNEFGHLRQLEIMDISGNELSGNIPAITKRYSILQRLNIARNRITGSIPKSLENLAALESLNLSSNNLSGQIPTELENHNALQIKLRVTTCVTKTKTNSDLVLKVIIQTSSFIVLVCALCLVCAVITKKKRKTINNESSSSELKGLPPRLSYSEIQLATNGFLTTNLIRRGAFGSVYRAVFSTGESGIHTTVAVKVLDLTQSKASKSFDAECEALRNIQHQNLVKVFTSCSSIDHTGAEFKALAMEFMSIGNLDKWLYPEDVECGSTLTLTQRLNIAIDVASALDHLHHDFDPPVVHCDLKPGNVLLDEDMTAHVGDFGLARFLSHDSSQNGSSTIGLKGSIGYIAPGMLWILLYET